MPQFADMHYPDVSNIITILPICEPVFFGDLSRMWKKNKTWRQAQVNKYDWAGYHFCKARRSWHYESFSQDCFRDCRDIIITVYDKSMSATAGELMMIFYCLLEKKIGILWACPCPFIVILIYPFQLFERIILMPRLRTNLPVQSQTMLTKRKECGLEGWSLLSPKQTPERSIRAPLTKKVQRNDICNWNSGH